MPWEIKRKGDEYCVVKKDGGAEVACHPSEEKAKAHVRALYASEKKEAEDALVALETDTFLIYAPNSSTSLADPSPTISSDIEEKSGEPCDYQPFLGATSFAELDALYPNSKPVTVKELHQQFSSLTGNIMGNEEIEDKSTAVNALTLEYQIRFLNAKNPGFGGLLKEAFFPSDSVNKAAIKRENGLDFPARDYAYAPDPMRPATWGLRLTETPGKVSLRQLQRIALLLTNEKAAGIPSAALNAVKRRVRAEFRKLGVADAQLPPSVREGVVVARRKEMPPGDSAQLEGLRPAPPEIEQIAKKLIVQTFPNLMGMRLALAVRDTVLPSGDDQFIVASTGVSADPSDPFDCIFWFAWDLWQILEDMEKEAIIFHELMHCNHAPIGGGQMRAHDAAVFNAEIERYGAWWKRPNAVFTGKQMLPSGDPGVPGDVNWNSVNWNSVNWNSVNWNSVNWNSVNWNSEDFRNAVIKVLTSFVNWNSVNWNSVNWNSVNWNSVNWNSVNWNSVNWNSVNWNSVNWNSEEFRRVVIAAVTYAVNWNSVNWNSVNWNSVNWNSVNWNSVNWNSVNWNSVNWNSVNWNSVNWNSVNWNSEAMVGMTYPAKKEVANNSFSVWKDESTGRYHWMAVYSNNFRDNDNPPEIISEKSHKAFTYLANEGILPMPELWHWHAPGSRWGITKQLDYVDGFAIAIGEIDPGFEKHAEILSQRKDLGVSHGMYRKNIHRDPSDPSVIDFHVTYEISDLPLAKAANKHTGFFVIKEQDDMPFSPDKREYLKQIGYDDQKINEMEKNLLGTGKALTQAGVESKDTTPPAEQKSSAPADNSPVTRAEIAQTLADVVSPLVAFAQSSEAINSELSKSITNLNERIGALEAQLKELTVSDASKISKAAVATPAASLSEMLGAALTKSNQVPANSTLLKNGPVQAEPVAPNRTPSGFLNTVIAKSHEAPAAAQ